MDQLHTRLDALEQRTHTVERQLRWWRGLACALLGLAVLTWALPSGTAQEATQGGWKGLEQRVAALESLLQHFTRRGNEVFLTGANLHLVNGLGRTDCGIEEEPIPNCPNGVGNLIVGYNESRAIFGLEDIRTGSHSVIVGRQQNFSRFGGLVVGSLNEISGDFAVVSGGVENTASGDGATISGGAFNTASGDFAVVSGGGQNTASSDQAAISGGGNNTASGLRAVVSGGQGNTASGFSSTVSGGQNRTAAGEFDWVAGSLVEDD